jgi:hypothetical protein
MERREALRLSAALMGTGLSGLVFPGMLQGCRVDTRTDWTPQFFTPDQAIAIAEMAEHILPASQTPGAKDVFVDRFLDKLISECWDEKTQKEFMAGLQTFQEKCRKKYGKGFEDCTTEERNAIMQAEEDIPYLPPRYVWGNKVREEKGVTFYRQFKGLVLFGYFSAEVIGKEVLKYDPVPGVFIGCMPLSEIGGAWTL